MRNLNTSEAAMISGAGSDFKRGWLDNIVPLPFDEVGGNETDGGSSVTNDQSDRGIRPLPFERPTRS